MKGLVPGATVRNRSSGTGHSINFDLGFNNYLEKGKFPDKSGAPYALNTIGSIYVALNSVLSSHIKGRFYLEWGGGISWSNFRLEDSNIAILKGTDMVEYTPVDTIFTRRSKLGITHLNINVVPVIYLGKIPTILLQME